MKMTGLQVPRSASMMAEVQRRALWSRTNGADGVGGRGGAKSNALLPGILPRLQGQNNLLTKVRILLKKAPAASPHVPVYDNIRQTLDLAYTTTNDALVITHCLQAMEEGKAYLEKTGRDPDETDAIMRTFGQINLAANKAIKQLLSIRGNTELLLALAVYDELLSIYDLDCLTWLRQRHGGFADSLREAEKTAVQYSLEIGAKLSTGLVEELIGRSQSTFGYSGLLPSPTK